MTLIFTVFLIFLIQSNDLNKNLNEITAFYFVDDNLASAGNITLDQYEYINAYGFKHVINLLPGNQLAEKNKVQSYGMSYTQIPVDFRNPTVDDFEKFKTKMQSLKGEKIFVHCAANMRASAFIFSYRVSQLAVEKSIAKKHMDKVWAPAKQWNDFIRSVLTKYAINPDYRDGNTFTMLVRQSGLDIALKSFKSKNELNEKELRNVANEIERENEDPKSAAKLYTFLTKHFPNEIENHLQAGRLYNDLNMEKEAITAFKSVLKIDKKHIVATKTLGKLGVKKYSGYWEGVDFDRSKYKAFSGRYFFDKWNRKMEISFDGNDFYIQPEWSQKKSKIFMNPDHEFFLQDFNWKVEFTKANSEINLIMMHGDRFPGKRIDD